jgi:hypothetical protein
MSNNFTFKDSKTFNKKELKASVQTIDFLKMVARSYRIERTLPPPVNSVYLN